MSEEKGKGSREREVPLGSLTMLGAMPLMMKQEPPKGVKGFLYAFWHQLSRCLLTGVMVWVPAIVTIWIVWVVISRLGFGVEDLIRDIIYKLNDLGKDFSPLAFLAKFRYQPGYGILIVLALFLSTGLVTRYWLARKLIRLGEAILNRIPFVRTVYRAAQQIRDVFVQRKGSDLGKACIIEYPRPGVWGLGFIMSGSKSVVHVATGADVLAVFVPTTPNPTSGFLLFVPRDQVIEVDISGEDAMKIIVSGGAFLPPPKSKVKPI